MVSKNFSVSGMHCNSCAQLIEITLEELPGINKAKVDYVSGKAIVEFDEKKTSALEIIIAIKNSGYPIKEV